MKIKSVTIDADVESVLRAATLNGNNLKLSGDLDRAMYVKVNKVMELIGFKWNRGAKCHVGQGDSADKLREALEVGSVVDEKKTYQFFETPDALADRMVSLADIRTKHKVLEPSAGKGAILRAIWRSGEASVVEVCEINPAMREELRARNGVHVAGEDFLLLHSGGYDRIVMNPPFTGGQDVEHILRACTLLRDDGILVAICSNGPRQNRILKPMAEIWEPLPSGTFAESGTNVATVLLKIRKNHV